LYLSEKFANASHKLIRFGGGGCYSEREVRTWLNKAGFSDPSKVGPELVWGQIIETKKYI